MGVVSVIQPKTAAYPIPDAALDDRLGWIGTSGSGKRDSRTGQKAESRPCAACGATFAPCVRRPQALYCSKTCVWRATRGPAFNARVARESGVKRGDAQRGRGAGKGYRKLMGRHEHRVIAEQKLGRALAPGEIVHHDDEIRANNSPENLEVLASQAEHARHHFTGSKQSPEHIRKRVESRARTLSAKGTS